MPLDCEKLHVTAGLLPLRVFMSPLDDVGEQDFSEASLNMEVTAGLDDEDRSHRSAPHLNRGTRVDRYQVLDWIGAGGMGVVYKAHDPMLDRTVAVKLFHHPGPGKAAHNSSSARFLREAQAMARLSHPNVLPVYDVGLLYDRMFIATEYVDGKTLSDWLRSEKRSWQEILDAFIEAGRGLAAAHAAGLIHRDFKPSNVLVGADDRIRVMDFGLARRLSDRGEAAETSTTEDSPSETGRSSLELDLTDVGAAVGTPAYMAPEQHEAREIDGRSDQFSFCVALYQSVYGSHPFGGANRRAIHRAIVAGRVEPPRDSPVPAHIRIAILRGLSYRPSERWPDMNSLLSALTRNPKRRRVSALLLGGMAVMTVGGIFVGRHTESAANLCAGSEDKIASVWSQTTKNRVRASLLASGLDYAASVSQRVEGLLDDYTQRWAILRLDNCAATQIRREQSEQMMDVRMACLDKRLFEVAAIVHTLESGDTTTVQNALNVVGSLTPLRTCQDITLPAGPPLPPEKVEAVDGLRRDVAEVKALSSAGHYGPARELGQSTLELAKKVGYEPVTAEAAFWLGYTEQKAGAIAEAEKHLLTAALEAEAGHDDELLVRARGMLVGLYGMDTGRYADVELWAEQAKAALRRLGGAPRLEAHLLNSLGVAQATRGRYQDALAEFDRAAQLLDGVQENKADWRSSDHEDEIQQQIGEAVRLGGIIHNNIAGVHERMARFADAREHYAMALEVFEAAYGTHHPLWATTAGNLGTVLHALGRDQQARTHLERARQTFSRSVGRDHPSYAVILVKLGELELHSGSFLTAEAMLQRALTSYEKTFGQPHPLMLPALELYARALAEQGDVDRAFSAFERALSTAETLVGNRHPVRGQILEGMARLELTQGRFDAARDHAEQAAELLDAELGPAHPDVASALTVLGSSLHRLGHEEAAQEHLERALSIRDISPGRPRDLARTRTALARLLLEVGQPARARSLGLAAADDFASAGPASQADADTIQAWSDEIVVR